MLSGRPPKHKTRSLVEAFAPATSGSSGGPPESNHSPSVRRDANGQSAKNAEPDKANSKKRTHAESKEPDDNFKVVNKNLILPQRRSSRQTTVYATQVSEGTLRPPGPPHLEAALNIALRNLESETWNFLWAFNEKNQGKKPLPTPAEIKALSKSVQRASEAADKADRELEEAIDEIMLSNNTRKKRRGPTLSKYVADRLFDTDSSASTTPIRHTPCQDQ